MPVGAARVTKGGATASFLQALGNTMSDEFVDVLLGKLVEALRPGSLEALEEATVNAALAIIDSMHPESELQAFLAVQIIAAGFSGLRLLRQSQHFLTADYINTYGNYAIKLLRLQNDMIQTFDRCRGGNKQTVEVRHVHIHSGGQGVVGIINPPEDREGPCTARVSALGKCQPTDDEGATWDGGGKLASESAALYNSFQPTTVWKLIMVGALRSSSTSAPVSRSTAISPLNSELELDSSWAGSPPSGYMGGRAFDELQT
jgi:hypothetical protein